MGLLGLLFGFGPSQEKVNAYIRKQCAKEGIPLLESAGNQFGSPMGKAGRLREIIAEAKYKA